MGDQALFDELFAEIPERQTRRRPYGTFDQYLEFVRGLHVGLAPLRPSPFNAGRGDTKFGIYAACGAAALLQDAPVYRPHADRARMFATPEDLRRCLDEAYHDRQGLRALAGRAHRWASRARSRSALRVQRERLYRSVLRADAGGDALAVADDSRLGERLAALGVREGRERLAGCAELIRECPRYAQAQWLYARTLAALGRDAEALTYADTVDPHPLYADLFAEMQARLAGRLRPDAAPRYAARVRSGVRRLRLEQKRAKDPLLFYRAILGEQPYDFFALSAVIRLIATTNPESPELGELYARAALVAPDTVPTAKRPEHLRPFIPR
jgi:hypothetical protein